MGFKRFLKKAGGKLLKSAIKFAPVALGAATGGASLGAVAASKLRTLGANRSKAKLAEKLRAGGEGLGTVAQFKKLSMPKGQVKVRPGMGSVATGSMGRPVQEIVAMRDPAVRELLNNEQRKGARAAVQGRASSTRQAAAIWKKLDAETRDSLKAEFKKSNPNGSQKAWADYVIANG
jgi:hypothetical protein